ncbi:MAG TPA: GNAT family N-acetyltransferase [Clostridiaceae bacterium]|nr:GNAT family N-acetyltransferase [Clostridiaceae bacterium]
MINHIGTQTIETDRLILRKFMMGDAQNMFDNWANDHQVTKYLQWKPHENIEVTKNILENWVKSYEQPDRYNWGIVYKENMQVIGSIAIVSFSNMHEWCEIGYCLSRNYWNTGIMTEALKVVIKFCFTKIGFNRVQAFHHVENTASGKVMLKAGMKYEGRLRQYHVNTQGVFVDCDMYSILKDEYLNQEGRFGGDLI